MATENDENMMIDEMVTIAKDQDHNTMIDVAMEAAVMVRQNRCVLMAELTIDKQT